MLIAQNRGNIDCYEEKNKNHPDFHNVEEIMINIYIYAYT